MKHTLTILIVFAALVQIKTMNPACFFRHLKILFEPNKIDFVDKLLKETENVPELHKMCVNMDKHGDRVLARWEKCVKCKSQPCRLPHLTYLISATAEMMEKLTELNAKLSLQMKTHSLMVANCKRIVDRALVENQNARLCPP